MVYYEEIAGGIVLYDYGASDDLDKLKGNVAKRINAYERAKKKKEETAIKTCIAIGGAIASGLAAGICYKALTEEGYGMKGDW